LVRAGLWEQDVQLLPYGNIKWPEVYRLATEQSVLGLVLSGLEHSDVKPPKELLLLWIGEVQMIEQRNKEMNAFVAELVNKLRCADIYALLVKGQGIAQCYEKPLWRACGDVDLYLSEDNYGKAKAFLSPLALDVEKEYVKEKHLGMTINGWIVELHGSLYCRLSSRIEQELDKVDKDTFYGGSVRSWNNNGMQIFLLKAENDVFYVFTHILQHFYKEGVGLRQVCDWCRLLWTYRDKLDLELLERRIERAALMTAWKAFGAYAVDYLGLPAEAMSFYSSSKKWSRKASRINKFILTVGNMGHNRDNCCKRKYPYLIRKFFSMGRRIGDLIYHARIFPMDSLKFFPYIVFNGVRSAVRGE
jgi:hypothetical protein